MSNRTLSKIKRGAWGKIIALVAILLIGGATGIAININIENGKVNANITYSEEEIAPEITDQDEIEKIETGQGEIKVDGETIKTVESVESTGPVVEVEDEEECAEGEECGRGAAVPQVNTSTPQAFLNQTLGGCYDVDGHYNEQCWDYAALFFLNYAGHTFYTCGTGAAKGAIADGCWQKNAGNEFVMIWDATQLQAGDWVVFNNGTYGHVGMATGPYNNGYVTLARQNQGGGLCPGSSMGAKVNIINISLKNFAGAFRPKSYIKPAPKPAPAPTPIPVTGCVEWHVARGDTMSKIMLECENTVVYGEPMNAYAKTWFSRIVKPGQSVYDGWVSESGVGLYAGDWIDHKINQ